MEQRKKKKAGMGKVTVYIMIILALSRVLGLAKTIIVTSSFDKMSTDAFNAAFTIPDFMYDILVAGALSSGFMPVFNSYLARDDEKGAWKSASAFITVCLIFILSFNVIGILFTQIFIPIISIGSLDDPIKYSLTVRLTRIMFSAVSFTAIAGLCKGILESYKCFLVPAWGPVLYNIGFIFGALVLGRAFNLGIDGLAVGVVIGAMSNLAIQLPSFMKVGKRFRLSLDLHDEGYRQMIHLMVPALIALSLNRVNVIVNQQVASFMKDGSFTQITAAYRVMMLPVGIFGASIVTTVFPSMNGFFETKQFDKFKDIYGQGLRTMFFLTIPSAIGLITLNYPIMRLLFKNGIVTEEYVGLLAWALSFYALGVIGHAAVPLGIRGFYSIKDSKTPLKIGMITMIVNLILNIVLVRFTPLGIGGIALTNSLVAMLEFYLLYKGLAKRLNGLRTRPFFITIIKSLIASLVMGGGAFITSRFIESKVGIASKGAQFVTVFGALIVAVIIYGMMAKMLEMPELDFFMSSLKKKFKKK